MEKNTRKMSKGNLTGIGVGLASLILSGCIVASYEKKMDDLTDNLDRVEEKAKKVIIIAEGYKQENSMYKLKISELTNSVQVLENEKLKLKRNLVEVKKANTALKSKLDKSRVEKLKAQKNANKKSSGVVVQKVNSSKSFNMEFTAYTSDCKGCSGKTFTGYDVRSTKRYNGMVVIATDHNVIPLYSIVRITIKNKTFDAIVLDKGGAIKGNKIDLLVGSYGEAVSFGRQKGSLTIIRNGKGS